MPFLSFFYPQLFVLRRSPATSNRVFTLKIWWRSTATGTSWPWTSCHWGSTKDRSPPSSDTTELARPQPCKWTHILSDNISAMLPRELLREFEIYSVEKSSSYALALFLIGQSWRGCSRPLPVRPTSLARTSALSSAPSDRTWASVRSTTYFSACMYPISRHS